MSRPTRRLILVLAVLLVALWSWRQQRAASMASATAPTSEELRLGEVVFRDCQIGAISGRATMQALCARYEVPENRELRGGRRVSLRLALIKSRAARPEPDLVTLLDGGPGGAATEDYPGVAQALSELRRHRHILLIDQRGTGGSNALRCDDRSVDDVTVVETHQQSGTKGEMNRELVQRELRQCLERLQSRADVRWYRTVDAIHDLEAVRRSLGGPQLNLIGVSYGTRVAQQYATAYPAAVRTVVLDSPVPNRLALGSEHARNLEDALRARFAACTHDPACQRRFGDPYRALYQLRDRLRAQPAKAMARDPVTFDLAERMVTAADLAGTVRLFSYDALTAALLPLTIDEALRGNYGPLLGQEKLITDTLNERLTDGVGLSVSCAEDADRLQPDATQANTLLGNSLVDYLLAGCEVWPHASRPPGFDAPFRTSLPVLVLAGEFDPVTPARYAREIVAQLPNARLLIAAGQGHAVMAAGCMPKLLTAFVVDRDARGLNTGCLAALGNVPAFTSFSGADP